MHLNLKETQQPPAPWHLQMYSSSPNNHQKGKLYNKPNLRRMSAPREKIHMNISFYSIQDTCWYIYLLFLKIQYSVQRSNNLSYQSHCSLAIVQLKSERNSVWIDLTKKIYTKKKSNLRSKMKQYVLCSYILFCFPRSTSNYKN
jgi:hypothetical protein